MSIQAVAWALEQDLPARPKLVLVSIANHANHTDGYCWLKAETIAGEAACTSRSVYRFIGGLVRNGYLRKAPRKGDDGKQRANDYWLLFNRETTKWDWAAQLGDDNEDINADDESDGDEDAPQDVVQPHDTASHGDDAPPEALAAVEQHAVSHGPTDSGVTRYNAQPSKTKPKEGAADFRAPPRAYHPPPVEPQGAVADQKAKQIFVFEGTPAYDKWAEEKSRANGVSWHLVTTQVIDGKVRRGWYFPSLFPPERHATGPPTQPEDLSEDDEEVLKEGLN